MHQMYIFYEPSCFPVRLLTSLAMLENRNRKQNYRRRKIVVCVEGESSSFKTIVPFAVNPYSKERQEEEKEGRKGRKGRQGSSCSKSKNMRNDNKGRKIRQSPHPSHELMNTLNKFPAPQNSLMLPLHTIEQLESAALVDVLARLWSQ